MNHPANSDLNLAVRVVVILRSAEHPHTRNLRKCDPVARGQLFRQSWAANRVPGEKAHKRLRWNVREQMLCRDTMEYKVSTIHLSPL